MLINIAGPKIELLGATIKDGILNSSVAYYKNPIVNLSLTEEDRAKVALTGAIPADIERILSDD